MFESTENDQNQTERDFQSHFPAVDHSHKHHSLEPDIIMGWKPKNKIMGPIPLNFDAKINDQVIDQLTSFGSKYKERVIFLGHRFQSSFKMHQEIQRNYLFKYQGAMGSNYQHMAAYFRKFHANFKSKYTRIFKGMNPTMKSDSQLTFESNFEGGNLDAVIKVGENQYDLFLRIDTNTRGHLQWFNFKIKNCGKKKIKLNIVNLQKSKTLYQRGMKPYIYSQYLKQTKEQNWFQGGDNVVYRRRKLNYDFLDHHYEPQYITFWCLSFSYVFEADWEEVQFAYAPTFTYTDMCDMIVKIKREVYNRLDQDSEEKEMFLKEENLSDSLSGLEIPLLTITDPRVDDKKKKCILMSGRVHPGESCGSYMNKGFLQYICSDCQDARYLRRQIVFKVIPMINPDGVVMGNFRTSLGGRDLNRTFRMKNQFLIPEVKALKDLVGSLKMEFKNRFLMFFDLHGHSVKKNVFIYGPEYEIWETNYYRTRIFPKLLATKTDMFRYYSCIFRIASFKKSTARAVILRNVPNCYTVEASNGFYYCPVEKKDIAFTPEKWMLMGRKIAEAIKDYMEILNEEFLIKEERRLKQISFRQIKNKRLNSRKNTDKNTSNKFQTRLILTNAKGKYFQNEEKQPEEQVVSQKVKNIIQLIKEDEKKYEEHAEGHQSDHFSEGGSDSQSNADIPEEELKAFEDNVNNYMQEYRSKFYREKEQGNNRSFHHPPPKRKLQKEDEKDGQSRKKSRGLELIASLRKKKEKEERTKQKLSEVLIWNKMKNELNSIKTKKLNESFQSRILTRQEYEPTSYQHKRRKHNFQSQILHQAEFGINQTTSIYEI